MIIAAIGISAMILIAAIVIIIYILQNKKGNKVEEKEGELGNE